LHSLLSIIQKRICLSWPNKSGIFHALKDIKDNEGPSGFFTGFITIIASKLAFTGGIALLTTEPFYSMLGLSSIIKGQILRAYGIYILASLFSYPFDTIHTYQLSNPNKGILEAFFIIKEKNKGYFWFIGFYKGFLADIYYNLSFTLIRASVIAITKGVIQYTKK